MRPIDPSFFPSPFQSHCAGCDSVLEGEIQQYEVGDEAGLICKECQREHACQYCGDYQWPLHTFTWDHYDRETGRDCGEMRVCSACEASFSKRRTA